MLARDELRVITVIPWADQWAADTVKRAWYWSDEVLVGMDVWRDLDADDIGLVGYAPESSEAMSRIWLQVETRYGPDEDTYICFLNSGEVFSDWASIRPAIRRHHGYRIGVTAYQMWDWENYRTDWLPPQMVFPFVPFRKFVAFDHPLQYVHRGPSATHNIMTVGHPAADLLSYRYATTETRHFWHGVYLRSDWPPHRAWVEPVLKPAQTKPWTKGGML